MDFFNQGIPLGRWFKINVIIHWTFVLYAVFRIYGSNHVFDQCLIMALLFGTVLMHEFGHALSCRAVGGEANRIILWPLGGIAFVQPPPRPWPWLITTVCGPLVNAVLWPVFYLIYTYWADPSLGPNPSQAHRLLVEACGFMWIINKSLLIFNLFPAYPMDGGRIVQEILWLKLGYPRSLHIAGMIGTVAGGILIALGLGLHPIHIPIVNFDIGGDTDTMLIVIGFMCAMQSFGIYKQSQQIQSWRKN